MFEAFSPSFLLAQITGEEFSYRKPELFVAIIEYAGQSRNSVERLTNVSLKNHTQTVKN